MAVNLNSSAQISSIQKYGSFIKYAKDGLMSKRSYAPHKKQAPVGITASIKNKVYEDQSQGIICYRDESGEIICEGYDEGPVYKPISRPTHHPRLRDAEIMKLLQQSWLQVGKGEEIDNAVEGARSSARGFKLQ